MKYKYIGKRKISGGRDRRRIVLIATEGDNKTEVNYLSGFSNRKHRIVFVKGNETDPLKMTRHLCADYERHDLDRQIGDLAYCVVDGDISKVKEKQIIEADLLIKNIGKVIVSNPCIEVWFLCHYVDSSRHYSSNKEVIKRLKDYIPNYNKNDSKIYELLKDKTSLAIQNAKHLEQFRIENRRKLHRYNNQPNTEIYKIIEDISDDNQK